MLTYASFAELEAACQAFMDEVNNREHRATRRKPAAVLAEEQPRLHRIPDTAHEVARHGRARPGSPAVIDEHFPGTRTRIPGDSAVKARTAGEAEFLAIGEGARTWLIVAAMHPPLRQYPTWWPSCGGRRTWSHHSEARPAAGLMAITWTSHDRRGRTCCSLRVQPGKQHWIRSTSTLLT